ncbi:LPXTG cell wall anchor domain-containing protein [Facklamia sp. 7083-14-GEN3]|uniref:LPXTG cell wall anchor domain-containing protein n=1 Tax=Facklamia sp. 7083-14-GEN3 TaxID=2973478 RepID=UPI00215D5D55|nr:LPXTG cell wall anchor domain-containing protein [Facklamia sp. 7083-14-GEN3]MCR8968865.1 LPXTG cell wall anchor domain-containing protein [Facklamia sp. 7083-14-GEN3]
MLDTSTLLLIIGLVIILGAIYFLSRKSKDSNIKPQVTDKSMNDPLGPVHINSDKDSSSNALGEDQFKNSVPMREGQAAQKAQHFNDQMGVDSDEASKVEELDTNTINSTQNSYSSNESFNHSSYRSVQYQEIVDNNGLKDEWVQLEGKIASFFTENLGVEGAIALGSLSTSQEESNNLVALKFINESDETLKINDHVKVYGKMQGLKVSSGQLVPAMLVDHFEKI